MFRSCDWGHKTGYVVNAVSTSDIGGSSSNNVKNYIQNAYQSWDNPPEIVGLIGDTGGSYSIGYFTENTQVIQAKVISHILCSMETIYFLKFL